MSRHREAENAENVIALERVLREARAEEEAVEAAVAGMNGAGSGWDEDPDWHLRYEPGAATVRPDIDPEADPGFPWLIDAADLLAEPDPGPTPWLVRDLIVDRALVAAVGRWKTTKTYGFLDVAISVVAGRPAFGALEVEQPGPVVYVIEESGRAALWRRLDALRRGRGIDIEELRGLHLATNERVRLDDLQWQNELRRFGEAVQPRLFVFDPIARMKSPARDENAQKEMAVVIDFLRELRDHTGAAVAIVHHVGHTGAQMRGSSDLESVWETRLTWEREAQAPTVKIRADHREAESSEPIEYRIGWDSETRSMRFDLVDKDHAGLDLADRILAYVAEHPRQKADEIAKGVDTRRSDVDRRLADLVTSGLLGKVHSGRRDKTGREIRDNTYITLDHHLRDGSSQTLDFDTPGTSHGTSHRASSHPRTNQDEPPAETPENRTTKPTVARPTDGTNQDEPPDGHRGPVARPTPLGVDARDEPPDEPPNDLPF
jgi:hypothetical protein